VHSSQTTLESVERDVALGHPRVQAVGFEFPLAEGTRKKAAMVFVHLRFDHESAWQLSFRKNQVSPAAAQISFKNSSRAAPRRSRKSASEG